MKKSPNLRRIEGVAELVQILQLQAVTEDSFSAFRGEPRKDKSWDSVFDLRSASATTTY